MCPYVAFVSNSFQFPTFQSVTMDEHRFGVERVHLQTLEGFPQAFSMESGNRREPEGEFRGCADERHVL